MTDPDWKQAACTGMSRDLFFPNDFELPDERAVRTCRRCLIREDCATYAIEKHEEFGIWGGLTEEQRQKASKSQSRVRCPDCRSDSVFADGDTEICLSCGLSWQV